MSLLISAHKLEKAMGDRQLFTGLSFSLHEKQRVALLGPNGAGKSTLLKILAGIEDFESGEVSPRKNLKLAYVSQDDSFPENIPISTIACEELKNFGLDQNTADVQASIYLTMAGFEKLDVTPKTLSGGWKKRLQLAIAFAKDADLILLDEPTNHLDWDGIDWLEGQLKTYGNAFLIVSHDREFLNNQAKEFMEINRIFQDGYLSLKCDYEQFLDKKEAYIENQLSMQESMANKARRETEWLRAGVKARTTKSRSRIKEAHQLIDDLAEVKSRNQSAKAKVDLQIDEGGKRSKKLIELKDLNIAYGEKKILDNFNLLMGPKTCLGLLGENASGKTSLLKVIAGLAENYSGTRFEAEGLKIVYFDQKREDLNPNINLMEYLGDGADHVMFKGRSIHVAAYAARFLFDSHRMNLPIERLSGGEQARLLIAKLLLQPADVLLLDEPTNDLDIQTIEILEQSLLNFTGLAILVSHDRYFLRNLCHSFVGLNGQGGWNTYADMNQWLNRSTTLAKAVEAPKATPQNKPKAKVKLSYMEKRRFENIEEEVANLEEELSKAQANVENNQDFSNHEKTQSLIQAMNDAQSKVDEAYEFWQATEEKLKSSPS